MMDPPNTPISGSGPRPARVYDREYVRKYGIARAEAAVHNIAEENRRRFISWFPFWKIDPEKRHFFWVPNLGKGVYGVTTTDGTIFMSWAMIDPSDINTLVRWLEHEGGHTFLSPTSGPLRVARANLKELGNNTKLLPYMEETWVNKRMHDPVDPDVWRNRLVSPKPDGYGLPLKDVYMDASKYGMATGGATLASRLIRNKIVDGSNKRSH